MAGIGFELRRLVQRDSGLLSRVRAYSAAGMIAAGPWLVTMASLWLVRVAAEWLGAARIEGFLSIVGSVFAASLVTVSGLQMAVTRFLADDLYSQSYGGLLPSFATCSVMLAAVQATTGLLACHWLGFEPALTGAVVLLYVCVSLTWLSMAWLTVIRQHDKVLLVYLLGGIAFVLALHALPTDSALADVVWTYALVNGFVVAAMSLLVARGLEAPDGRRADVLVGVWRHRVLLLTGTLYGLSLWSDKWIFWILDGVPTIGALRHHPLYDACFYLGYLTVVPALSINLVHLETRFYERYRDYFGAVTGNATLRTIRSLGQTMADSLRDGTGRLLRIQGGVTVACIALAEPIVDMVGLPPYAARVFRFACVGAFCHVLLLLTILLLLYFDRRHAAARACLWFFACNVVLAWASVAAGPWTYGAGVRDRGSDRARDRAGRPAAHVCAARVPDVHARTMN